jgi:pantothenate kinase
VAVAFVVDRLADELLTAVDAAPARFVLGIAGPPGAGKTTLAAALAGAVREQRGDQFAAVAPLDGFHLPNRVLDERRLGAVKGAPETFDVGKFVRLLEQVRDAGNTVLWPEFDRSLDEPTPDAIAIAPEARLVITEGNYLLLDRPGWSEVQPLLDDVWYVDAPRDVLRSRLIERQLAGGRTEEEAVRHVDESDLPNARLVARTQARAGRTLRP